MIVPSIQMHIAIKKNCKLKWFKVKIMFNLIIVKSIFVTVLTVELNENKLLTIIFYFINLIRLLIFY